MNTQALEIPAALKREPNTKGITLSGGVDQPKAVTATAAKTEPKADRVAKARLPKPVKAKPAKVAKVKAPKKPATVIDPATGEAVEKVRRSIVPMKFKERYAKHGGTCGDDMALELKAATTTRNADKREVLDVETLWAIAKLNQIDVAKYVGLNNGQKRMNVGNKLRGLLAAGTDAKIGKRKFAAENYEPRE